MKVKKGCIFIVLFFVVLIGVSIIFTLLQKEVPSRERVALIKIEGVIVDAKRITEELEKHVKDRSIRAIVLRIDSPGGGVVPSQEIHEAVKKAVAQKPVVVSMGSIAASGGYYIASHASRIIANPGTITGSIGVIMKVPNIEELMDKFGIEIEVIKSGEHKDMASIFRDIGNEERIILRGVMDDVHEQFIEVISEGREIPIEDVRKIADGRIFSGRQALEVGLVDELGSLDHAIRVAAEMAGIEGEPEVIIRKERPLIFDLIRGKISGELLRIIPKAELKYLHVIR